MPATLAGKNLIKDYSEDNHITISSLAATFGVGKVYMG